MKKRLVAGGFLDPVVVSSSVDFLGSLDIMGAFLQADAFNREVYVRALPESGTWNLLDALLDGAPVAPSCVFVRFEGN